MISDDSSLHFRYQKYHYCMAVINDSRKTTLRQKGTDKQKLRAKKSLDLNIELGILGQVSYLNNLN